MTKHLPTLDEQMRADPTRCSGCGYHVETMGHKVECALGRRAPVDPMTEFGGQTLTGVVRPAVVTVPVAQPALDDPEPEPDQDRPW